MLTENDAVEIYRAKQTKTRNDAARLGEKFGVTAKAVRDVWRRRTWTHATRHLWSSQEMREHLEGIRCPTCKLHGVGHVEAACQKCVKRIYRPSPSKEGAHGLQQKGADVNTSSMPAMEQDVNPLATAEVLHEDQAYSGDCDFTWPTQWSQSHDLSRPDCMDIDLRKSGPPADSEVSVAYVTSLVEYAQAISHHAPVFTNVQFNDEGWLVDPRVIAYFLSHPPECATEV